MFLLKSFLILMFLCTLSSAYADSCALDSKTPLFGPLRFHYTFACNLKPIEAFYCKIKSINQNNSNLIPLDIDPYDPITLSILSPNVTIDGSVVLSYKTNQVANVGLINLVYFLPKGIGNLMQFTLEINSSTPAIAVDCFTGDGGRPGYPSGK